MAYVAARSHAMERCFEISRRGTDVATEIRAGLTTFMVMAYIIFVNPIILGFTGVPGLDGKGLPFAATLTVTCLAAGGRSIRDGLARNLPLPPPPGLGRKAGLALRLGSGPGVPLAPA